MSSTINRESQKLFRPRQLMRRFRPVNVERQLDAISGLTSAFVLKRANEDDKDKQLSLEALISIIRWYISVEDIKSADELFLKLIGRLSGTIANKMRIWTSISKNQAEDVRQEMILEIYQYVTSLSQSEELWECNFKTCFDLRMLTLLGRTTRRTINTLSTTGSDDDESGGDDIDPIDPNSVDAVESLHIKQSLQYLESIDPRLGRAFYLKVFVELPEKEIADLMEVSERTVRNLVATSKQKLRDYLAEQ